MDTKTLVQKIYDHASGYNHHYLLGYDGVGDFVGIIHVDDAYPADGLAGYVYAVRGNLPEHRVRYVVEDTRVEG